MNIIRLDLLYDTEHLYGALERKQRLAINNKIEQKRKEEPCKFVQYHFYEIIAVMSLSWPCFSKTRGTCHCLLKSTKLTI